MVTVECEYAICRWDSKLPWATHIQSGFKMLVDFPDDTPRLTALSEAKALVKEAINEDRRGWELYACSYKLDGKPDAPPAGL